MPVFDYQCEKCETTFEVERGLTATGPVKCKNCGSTRTTKVFSAAGIVFKGSGFYVTDSKSSSDGGSKPASGKPLDKPAETADTTPAAPAKPADSSKPGKAAAKPK
jgi:putative FmdB family regulatory protein